MFKCQSKTLKASLKEFLIRIIWFFFIVCPSGYFINVFNNDTIEMCPINTFSMAIDSRSCMACPSGTSTLGLTGRTQLSDCSKFFGLLPDILNFIFILSSCANDRIQIFLHLPLFSVV